MFAEHVKSAHILNLTGLIQKFLDYLPKYN